MCPAAAPSVSGVTSSGAASLGSLGGAGAVTRPLWGVLEGPTWGRSMLPFGRPTALEWDELRLDAQMQDLSDEMMRVT